MNDSDSQRGSMTHANPGPAVPPDAVASTTGAAIDPAILAAIPHRPPMLLVERILERSDDRIVCEKTFTSDEFFVQGHYPGQPIVPGVILCESAMQSGAVLLSDKADASAGVPVATRINEVKFKRMVRPGDTIRIEARLTERLADAFFMTAKITVDGQLAARLDFACAIAKANG
jgi:3-hydroxyacyl-[acyl-carrier-protein] dehydratase